MGRNGTTKVIPSGQSFNGYEKYAPLFGSLAILGVGFVMLKYPTLLNGRTPFTNFIVYLVLMLGLIGLGYSVVIHIPRMNWNASQSRIELYQKMVVIYQDRQITEIPFGDIDAIEVSKTKVPMNRSGVHDYLVDIYDIQRQRIFQFHTSHYPNALEYLELSSLQSCIKIIN